MKLYEALNEQEIAVVRGQYGLSMTVGIDELVVGDVIQIETGMRIPADCILFEGQDVACDETIYNEGRPLINKKEVSRGNDHHRDNPDPFLLANSLVISGQGKAVVCAVGKHTRYTHEFPVQEITEDDNLTPLQERLEKLAGYLGKWGYIAGFLIFVSMTLFLIFQVMFDSDTSLLSLDTLQRILRYFTIGISIVIVAVPEGLPLAITIAMAFSVDTMKRDNLLVKKMEAPENLGFTRDILTGKTATLTANDMTVNQFYIGEKTYENSGEALNSGRIHPTNVEILKDCIIMNCDARVEMSLDGFYKPEGNGTEVAMLKFL